MPDKPAPPGAPPGDKPPGKKSNRKWLYIAGGVLAIALLVLLTKSKTATAETGSVVGTPEGGSSGAPGSTGTGTTSGTVTTPAEQAPKEPAPVAPPINPGLGPPLRPGETREEEVSTAGGSIRIAGSGGEREPAAVAASSAGGEPVKYSRNAQTRALQEKAVAKGENPANVPDAAQRRKSTRETSKAKPKPKPKPKAKAKPKPEPKGKAKAKPKAKKPASHPKPPHKAPARKKAQAKKKPAKRRR